MYSKSDWLLIPCPWVRCCSVAVVLMLSLVSSSFAQQTDDSNRSLPEVDPDITRFLQPLQQHRERLVEIRTTLERLQGNVQPGNDELLPYAQALVQESIAFRNTLHAFRTSKVRRGLTLELDLLKECQVAIEDSGSWLVQLGHLADQESGQETETVAGQIEAYAREFVQGTLSDAAEEMLARHGLEEVLNAEGWEDARKIVGKHLRQRTRNLLDSETYQLFGMRFHDLESAKVAVRHKVFDNLDRVVTKYAFQISGNELVVLFIRHTVLKWVVDDLYPRLREALRVKGNLEFRVEQSLVTLAKSKEVLNRLGSEDIAPADVPLRDVRKAINGAVGARVASRYLERDLQNAKREKLLQALREGQRQLRLTEDLTRRRFMLDKAEQIEKLKAQEDFMALVIEALRKVEQQLGQPEEKRWAIWHLHQAPDKGPVIDGVEVSFLRSKPSEFNCLFGAPRLYELQMENARRLIKIQLARNPDSPPNLTKAWRQYEGRILFRLSFKGQVRYVYQVSRNRIVGDPRINGLQQGQHQVDVEMFLEDGQVLVQQFWLDVGHSAEPKILERWQDTLQRSRASLERATKPRDVNSTTGALINHLIASADNPLDRATYSDATVLGHLQEAWERLQSNATNMEPGDLAMTLNRHIDACANLSSPASYKLAQQSLALLEATAAGKNELEPFLDKGCIAVGNLALAASGDVDASRKYLLQGIEIRKKNGKLRDTIYQRLISELPTPIAAWTKQAAREAAEAEAAAEEMTSQDQASASRQ